MKKLSIEQKAKRYDEAIERAKSELNSPDKRLIEYIFPELKESEDERIRKGLIEACKQSLIVGGFHKDKVIAWLKKQGEHDVYKESFNDGYKLGYREASENIQEEPEKYGLCKIEKQDEQKPVEWDILSAKKGDMLSNGTIVLIVDSIEEFEGRPIINSWYFADSEKFYGKGTSECDRWEVGGFRTATKIECNYLLKMIADAGYEWDAKKKELKKIEQKTAWSEEDELHIRELESLVKQVWATAEHGNDKDTIHKMSDLLFFLKTLKPQLKQEWSEEDESRLDIIFERIERGLIVDKDDIDRLKSLKYRYTWKPSDEHYELEEFAKIVRGNLTGISKAVQKLFEAKYLQLTGNKMYGGYKD